VSASQFWCCPALSTRTAVSSVRLLVHLRNSTNSGEVTCVSVSRGTVAAPAGRDMFELATFRTSAHLRQFLPTANQSLAIHNRKPSQIIDNNQRRPKSIASFCRVFCDYADPSQYLRRSASKYQICDGKYGKRQQDSGGDSNEEPISKSWTRSRQSQHVFGQVRLIKGMQWEPVGSPVGHTEILQPI
jgi:hypothetical protein